MSGIDDNTCNNSFKNPWVHNDTITTTNNNNEIKTSKGEEEQESAPLQKNAN